MTTDFRFVEDLMDKLDGWVNQLAAPLMPPRRIDAEPDGVRFELREHIPHTVMIGKCVRAVSGIHAALALANLGYVVECGALLRMVSEFCSEITTIGEALDRGGELPRTVQTFVDQYFVPRPATPEQFEAAERIRYVSREELMKTPGHLAEKANLDVKQGRKFRRFLNMSFDAFVHGAYETTMELCDPATGRFMMRGHRSITMREGYTEFVLLKLHEVVCALEFTAAVTGHAEIFQAARDARHAMDNAAPWKRF